jgi:hypothetical protein
MDFIEYANSWSKSEVTQGRIMIATGILVLLAFVSILKSNNEFLRGALIPLSLLVLVLIGYGSYILYSRPAHVQSSIELYKQSKEKAIESEKEKHINDNKAGKTLTKYVYPGLVILSSLMLFFVSSPNYKGMAIGFIILFAATYIIDTGFVSRSDAFLEFLNKL